MNEFAAVLNKKKKKKKRRKQVRKAKFTGAS